MNGRDTSNRIRGVSAELRQAAYALRRNLTPAEQRLWEAIKGQQVQGLRFRRQHPLGQFVLDFYCPALKLVLEVDGAVHHDRAQEDEARTRHLEAYGCRLLRFDNAQVIMCLPNVLTAIRTTALSIETGARSHPAPPELGAGGLSFVPENAHYDD